MRRRLRSVLVVAAWLAATVGPGMEVPGGLIALPPGPGAQVPCGGTAVVVSDDGLALTLEEALPLSGPDPAAPLAVILPDGSRRPATIVRRGLATTAVLLRLAGPPGAALKPLALADSAALRLGDTVWTAGNVFGAIALNGDPALSRGLVSGRYAIPADEPPVRGRGGRILSAYRGAVLETDAAVNDGNQGGALLDAAGRLVGLVSLGTARERRLGTAVPIDLVLRDLGLDLPLATQAPQDDPTLAALVRAAEAAAPAVALVYLERLTGLGNPEAVPRPPRLVDEAPSYERERLQGWWDAYYHQQQMFYTDQPVTALVVDPAAGLLLTAASNLHGDAERGQVLLPDGATIPCAVLATHQPLDLALLKAERPLPLPALTLADAPRLAVGTPVALIGRHRLDGGHTLTSGVISAANRQDRRTGIAFAQTDAHANYGNLGGAVVDADGAVVGMLVLLGPHEQRWLSAHEERWLGAHEEHWLGQLNSGVALLVDSAAIRQALPTLIKGQSTK
jgi:S1-C subfamily serine protease